MGLGKKLLIGFGVVFVLAVVGNLGSRGDQVANPVVQADAVPPRTEAAPASVVAQPVAAAPVALSDRVSPLRFGKPTVKTDMGMTTVMVQATNATDRGVSCMVTATFLRGDTILATANGVLQQCAPGATKTVELMSTDGPKGFDTVRLEASTCF